MMDDLGEFFGAQCSRTITILVDARCLQDERFRERGIGHHAQALLRGLPAFAPPGSTIKLVAAVDRRLPSLTNEQLDLFDREVPISSRDVMPDVFISPSPLTHTPNPFRWLMELPRVFSFAVVHDFIPLEQAGRYLRAEGERKLYLECLSALADYRCFISNSQYTADRLKEVLGVSSAHSCVSGVAVRESIVAPTSFSGAGNYIIVVGGDDDRKNLTLPIRAHAASRRLQASGIELRIVGHFSESWRAQQRHLYASEGGHLELLKFYSGLSDAELGGQYGGALLSVCPSKAEGFSIPVVEANANGCLVFVSTCAAQMELVPNPKFHFDPDDVGRLQSLMEMGLDENVRQQLLREQGEFSRDFTESAVCKRFWDCVFDTLDGERTGGALSGSAFSIGGKAKPLIAVASPVPPDFSGVAEYTAATMAALSRRADIDLFTTTERPRTRFAFRSVSKLSSEPYVERRHDALLSVIGNSHFHTDIFNYLLDYGGSAIAHDARMLHFYAGLLGRERTTAVASREAGRQVAWGEVERWLGDQRSMPILFLSEVLEASEKTFVHSSTTQDLIGDIYGRSTEHLPFAIYRAQLPEFVGFGGRERARSLLGVDDDVKLLITLGDVTGDKGIEECIWATAFLARWGVDVRFAIVGNVSPAYHAYLVSMAQNAEVLDRIYFSGGAVDERTYQAYLAAADAGIQFRAYQFGGLSGALLDEIAVGLPVVANSHLAKAMESPSYIASVPDGLSPILAAEALLEIFDVKGRGRNEEEREAFVHAHSTDTYAAKLLEALGLE